MISERKLAANRLNAQKSTGPKTAQGKATVAGNAIKHGLCARAAILPGEDESGYLALADALRRDLQPVGIVQREIVDHIAQLTWKLRRVPLIESAMMQREIEREHEYERRNRSSQRRRGVEQAPLAIDPIKLLACEFAGSADNGYARLELYRLRLERSLYAAYRELRKMREETAGEEIVADESDDSSSSNVAWASRPRRTSDISAGETPTPHSLQADHSAPCITGVSPVTEDYSHGQDARDTTAAAPDSSSGQNKPTDSPELPAGHKLDDSECDPIQPARIEKPPIKTAQIENPNFAFSGTRQRHPL